MKVTKQLTMKLDQRDPEQLIDAVQGDTCSREVSIVLTAGGQPWQIPDGAVANMRYRRPDGTGGSYEKLPDGTDAFTIQDNTILAILSPEMLTVDGKAEAQVELTSGDKTLATFIFLVMVQPDPQCQAAQTSSPAEAGMASFYFTVTEGEDGNYTADRTYVEVMRKFNAGYAVYCKITVDGLACVLAVSGQSDGDIRFSGNIPEAHLTVTYSKDGQITVAQEDLSREVILVNTDDTLPAEVLGMLLAGKNVSVCSVTNDYGLVAFNGLMYVQTYNAIYGSGIVCYDDSVQQACLCGHIGKGTWALTVVDTEAKVAALAKYVEELELTPGPDGPQGPAGADGADGGYYTPDVVDNQNGEFTFTFTPSKADMPKVGAIAVRFPENSASGLPEVTAEDNDKILQVVGGEWTVATAKNMQVVKESILEETTYSFAYNNNFGAYSHSSAALPFMLEGGKEYTVSWDGTEYIRTAFAYTAADGAACVGIGNPLVKGEASNGDVFAIVLDTTNNLCHFLSLETMQSHTIAIYRNPDVATKEYVQSYVEQYIGEALGGEY